MGYPTLLLCGRDTVAEGRILAHVGKALEKIFFGPGTLGEPGAPVHKPFRRSGLFR
jgi:hypothetical protein